uniref:Uncharacterized protein n=1 Tax=Anopheles albimanus TaxID=7167 RepID=A0A182FYG6_ANOAL
MGRSLSPSGDNQFGSFCHSLSPIVDCMRQCGNYRLRRSISLQAIASAEQAP